MPLADYYSRFRVAERLLLTGHSHQAWPDVSFDAQERAWLDAAEMVDDKWERAREQAARVQTGFRRLLADPDGDIALGQNTHELVTRLLSALPLGRPIRSRIAWRPPSTTVRRACSCRQCCSRRPRSFPTSTSWRAHAIDMA